MSKFIDKYFIFFNLKFELLNFMMHAAKEYNDRQHRLNIMEKLDLEQVLEWSESKKYKFVVTSDENTPDVTAIEIWFLVDDEYFKIVACFDSKTNVYSFYVNNKLNG